MEENVTLEFFCLVFFHNQEQRLRSRLDHLETHVNGFVASGVLI